MSFRIPRRDTEIRFVIKFSGNRPLRSCRKVVWFTTKKLALPAGLVPAPILPKMGRSRSKLPERCHPLTCPVSSVQLFSTTYGCAATERQSFPNLVRIGCVLPDLFRKDWFFGPKSLYNIGFQPTITILKYDEVSTLCDEYENLMPMTHGNQIIEHVLFVIRNSVPNCMSDASEIGTGFLVPVFGADFW